MKLLEYKNGNLYLDVFEHNFISVLGKGNKIILNHLYFNKSNNFITLLEKKLKKKDILNYRKNVSIVTYEHINSFTSETVEDELAYGLENQGIKESEMHKIILEYSVKFNFVDILNDDPQTIGTSKKALLKTISSILCGPKVIVLDNILCCLNRRDKEMLLPFLIDYVKKGNSIINFTCDIEDTLYGNYIVLTDEEKTIASGRTISILNEEKLMNRLGLSLPFIFDLNKQLMYYEIIDEFYLDERSLVEAIWK